MEKVTNMAARGVIGGEANASGGRIHGRKSYRIGGGAEKKSLPEPTHIGHFLVMVAMKVCKRVLFIDTSVKIGVYVIGVLVGSILSDLFVFPKSYFSDSRNFFNQYFVKLGWGWTLTLLSIYVCLTSFVYTIGNRALVRRHLSRLLVSTFWWYACTSVFVLLEQATGICSRSSYTLKQACQRAGKVWIGFDISGHVFLLVHNCLTISEELKSFKDWKKIEEILLSEDQQQRRGMTSEDLDRLKIYYKTLTPYIKITIVLITLLSLLWECMLLVSTVYRFHTLLQKIFAAFVALICWFFSYQVLYRSKSDWLPNLPGECPLRYTKII